MYDGIPILDEIDFAEPYESMQKAKKAMAELDLSEDDYYVENIKIEIPQLWPTTK